MALQDRIRGHFEGTVQTALDSAEALAPGIESAAHMIVHCLTQGGKVLALGVGGAEFLARYYVSLMVNRYEAERPGLAAIALAADVAMAQDNVSDPLYARQVRALGLPGDVLLALDTRGHSSRLAEALDAARSRSMIRVVLATQSLNPISEPGLDDEVNLIVPATSRARMHELQLLALHCLCDAVDSLLLGVE